jgi:F-type H+-transporting ATPase subunit delta
MTEADPQKVGQDLSGFAALLSEHEMLGKVLLNPAVSTARKRAVVSQITTRTDGMTPAVARLLILLAERDRLRVLPQVVEAYGQRLMDHLKMARAEVTTAEPLLPDRTEALRRSLVAATGLQVSLVTHVKPAILGGVVARVGGTVYDGSIARQLERMKDRLLEGT